MRIALNIFAILVIIVFSCLPTIAPTDMIPRTGKNIMVEAFRFNSGKIYVVKSEIIPGEYYIEGSTRTPKRKRVWMEIYVAYHGRIIMDRIINATMIPAKPEQWEFEKETNGKK